MPSYQITLTQLEMLKDEIRRHKILGIGMLSHFLGINFRDIWRYEHIFIRSMYSPDEDFCDFDFVKGNVCITKNKVEHYTLYRNKN